MQLPFVLYENTITSTNGSSGRSVHYVLTCIVYMADHKSAQHLAKRCLHSCGCKGAALHFTGQVGALFVKQTLVHLWKSSVSLNSWPPLHCLMKLRVCRCAKASLMTREGYLCVRAAWQQVTAVCRLEVMLRRDMIISAAAASMGPTTSPASMLLIILVCT